MKKLLVACAVLLVLPCVTFAGTLPVIPWQASSYPSGPHRKHTLVMWILWGGQYSVCFQ